jgi:hypothetical protein
MEQDIPDYIKDAPEILPLTEEEAQVVKDNDARDEYEATHER